MIKKLPWKNIIIVFTAMLVVPVIAFAITTTANPDDVAKETNSNIQITSDQGPLDAASSATSVLTAGALGYLDAATSATGLNLNNQGGGTDAVSSATGNPGATGSIGYDDDQYENDDDDEDEYDEEDDD